MAVVCDRDLPDGSWRELASALHAIPDPPLLFVACRDPRGLWFEVVRSGGFDVVLKPFERGEITWALTTAWCYWSDRATRAKGNQTATCTVVSNSAYALATYCASIRCVLKKEPFTAMADRMTSAKAVGRP